MNTQYLARRRVLTASVAALISISSLEMHAQTWDGGGGNDSLATAANWNPNVLPGINDDVIFAGVVRLTPDVSSAFEFNSLTFDNTAGPFIFGGTATLTIKSGGLTNNDSDLQIFGNAMNFGRSATSSINATAGSIALNGGVSIGSSTVTLTGAGGITLGAAPSGAGTIIKNSTGSLTFVPAGSAIDADIILNAGPTFLIGSAQNFSSSSVAVKGTATLNLNQDYNFMDGAQLTRDTSAGLTIGAARVLTFQSGADAVVTGAFALNTASTLVVTGIGSTFSVSDTLTLGGGSNTSITVGGRLSTQGSSVSIGASGDAIVTVDGNGSSFSGGQLDVGLFGNSGSLTFRNGSVGVFDRLSVSNSGFVGNSGTILIESGATVSASGDFRLAGSTAANSGTATITGEGSALTVASSSTIGGFGASIAVLEVQAGAAFTSTGDVTLNPSGTININGGIVTTDGSFTNLGGTFNFIAGALSIGSDFNVGTGGLLGTDVAFDSARRFSTAATTTIDPFRTLTLDGGTFGTGVLVNNGTFDFKRGTLAITGTGGFEIGAGALGSNVVLAAGASLQVTNTTTVAAGALLRTDGGEFSGSDLVNDGTIDHRDGGLNFTGSLTNNAAGRLFVSGLTSPAGSIANAGRITLLDSIGFLGGAGALTNTGLITGDGTVAKPVTNSATGQLRAETGKTLLFTGAVAPNEGTFSLQGGTLEFTSAITNAATGFIAGRGSLITAGVMNEGVMAFSGGTTDVYGDVTNASGARIATSGAGSVTTFFDDVVHNGQEIFTGASASTVFFGDQSGAGPFTGTGTVYYIGDLRPGNSPGIVSYGGDLVFGAAASLVLEIGGVHPGDSDHLEVAGTVFADGILTLSLFDGFLPEVGDTFDLLDAAEFAGGFDSISAPSLPGGLTWDLRELPSTGSVKVIPEPASAALVILGISLLGLRHARPSCRNR